MCVHHFVWFLKYVALVRELKIKKASTCWESSPKHLAWDVAWPRFQASPEQKHVYVGRAQYLFSCEHDVIEIRPEFLEQKGNVFCVVQPTMHSTLGVYGICSPITRDV